MIVFLVAPDLRTLGGFESQLVALANGLSRAGHVIRVFIREPVREDHPGLVQMAAAGVAVDRPGRLDGLFLAWRPAHREAVRAMAARCAYPLLAAASVPASLVLKRPFGEVLRGAAGRWHGLVSRVLFADRLTRRLERALDRALQLQAPDVIDVQHSMIPMGIDYARIRGIPVVYTEYGAPSMTLESVWAGLRPVVNRVDMLIGRAEASLTGLRDVCGLQDDRPRVVVPNAVTAAPRNDEASALALPMDNDGVVITTVGRLSPEKGTAVVVAAVARLVADGLPVRLVLAGDGPLRASLEAQTAALGIHEKVHFAGQFEELAPLMRATHIVAHPTLNDGRSVSVLEAMAWGRPVVATAVGGLVEIVQDGVTGLSVPPGDPEAMAAALRRLVCDPALRKRMGTAGRRAFLSGGYTVDAMVQQTVAAYEEAIGCHRAVADRADVPR